MGIPPESSAQNIVTEAAHSGEKAIPAIVFGQEMDEESGMPLALAK